MLCESWEAPSGAFADGNLTSYMCARCADHAVRVATAKVRLMLADPDRFGAHPSCPTCGRHTMRWQDILERRPI